MELKKIKNAILGITIAIIFVMFCVYGVKLIYDAPEREDFCGRTWDAVNEEECVEAGGDWIGSEEVEDVVVKDPRYMGYCRETKTCQDDYQKARENYSKNLFIIALVVGVVVIAVSALSIEVGSVSIGLMIGSLIFIIYGTSMYWQYMDDWLRFIVLGVVLAILIFLGYKMAGKK